jgi:hypothetical protein
MAQFWLTFLLTLFVGVETGLVSSVIFSLILVVSNSTQPRITVGPVACTFSSGVLRLIFLNAHRRSSATSTMIGFRLTSTRARRRTSQACSSSGSATRSTLVRQSAHHRWLWSTR